MDNRAMEKHTDLAIEVRESFPEDSVEIDGVFSIAVVTQ